MAVGGENAVGKPVEYRYFIAFISKECSGYQYRNDIVSCDEKVETVDDIRRMEQFLASKHLASSVVIQTIQLI
jgi:hypothetical protein